MTERICGVMSAANTPGSTRPAISAATVGAAPHSTEAAVKPATPAMNIPLRPNALPSRPPVTRSTPEQSGSLATIQDSAAGGGSDVVPDRRQREVDDRDV